MFQVTVVVLVRFRVNDDRVIDSGRRHEFEQMLGGRGFRRPIGAIWVVGKSRLVRSGETVQMRVDHRRFRIGREQLGSSSAGGNAQGGEGRENRASGEHRRPREIRCNSKTIRIIERGRRRSDCRTKASSIG